MKGRERSMAIRSGINKQGWQKTDFPVACQKCYGENPYMRMLKQDYGQECRICFRPFTVFKWKGDRGIYKRTCVCQSCSKEKNICQVCTLDLEFGLPMNVRDKRCGKNGKFLLDQNFTNVDNQNFKPPPPPGPPPSRNVDPSEKELVYIPEKDSDDEEQKPQEEPNNENQAQVVPDDNEKNNQQQQAEKGDQSKEKGVQNKAEGI